MNAILDVQYAVSLQGILAPQYAAPPPPPATPSNWTGGGPKKAQKEYWQTAEDIQREREKLGILPKAVTGGIAQVKQEASSSWTRAQIEKALGEQIQMRSVSLDGPGFTLNAKGLEVVRMAAMKIYQKKVAAQEARRKKAALLLLGD